MSAAVPEGWSVRSLRLYVSDTGHYDITIVRDGACLVLRQYSLAGGDWTHVRAPDGNLFHRDLAAAIAAVEAHSNERSTSSECRIEKADAR